MSIEVEAYRPFFVLGEVTTAGQYPFINGMTVQNAVAVAGGFTPRGSQGDVDITRIVNGRPVTFAAPLTFPCARATRSRSGNVSFRLSDY